MSRIVTVDAHSTFWRQLYQAGKHDTLSSPKTNEYLRVAGRDDFDSGRGYELLRPGSVIGATLCGDCTVFVTDVDNRIEVRINNVVVLSTEVLVTGTGKFTAYTTQSVGIDTFAAGDFLTMTYDSDEIGITVVGVIGVAELEFDSGKVIDLGEEGYHRTARLMNYGAGEVS